MILGQVTKKMLILSCIKSSEVMDIYDDTWYNLRIYVSTTLRWRVGSLWSNKATRASSTASGAHTKSSILSFIAIFLLGVDTRSPSSVNISSSERLLAMLVRSSLNLVCSRSWLALSASCINNNILYNFLDHHMSKINRTSFFQTTVPQNMMYGSRLRSESTDPCKQMGLDILMLP